MTRHPRLFDRIVKELAGDLDLIVYASGAMPKIGEHEYNFEKDRTIIEVNVLGAMAWLNPAAALMETQQKGTIIGISSIAGETWPHGEPRVLHVQAALTTFLESLRNRLHRCGVSVVTIKPGFVDTAMTQGMEASSGWSLRMRPASRS